jgi:hypothetical protein
LNNRKRRSVEMTSKLGLLCFVFYAVELQCRCGREVRLGILDRDQICLFTPSASLARWKT